MTITERLQSGDARFLARALSRVVEREAGAEAMLREIFPATGHAAVIGVTGAPGSGKSTLVDGLSKLCRAAGETVGIVAVDPTSPYSGGAILGDRIRMQAHHADPGIFIRSLATRGALGGLAAAASDVVTVLDAAGKDRIIVETVGVGQDEVDVMKLADVTVVVLVPGMGDEVQAIKAGIMEIADVFAINKADRGPERLEQEIKAMLTLGGQRGNGESWTPPIIKTVATAGEGVEGLRLAIDERMAWVAAHGGLRRQRSAQWEQRLRQFTRDRLAERLLEPHLSEQRLRCLADRIVNHGTDPYAAADELIDAALRDR